MTANPDNAFKKIASNRKAFRDFHIIEKHEAGIELQGTEVKAVRASDVNMKGSHARVQRGEMVLFDLHIKPYEYGNRFNHEPARPRRLLLHKREIRKLQAQTEQKGFSLIPLSIYMKRGRVKIELGLCRGKQQRDKRETLKRKTAERDAEREMARRRRR